MVVMVRCLARATETQGAKGEERKSQTVHMFQVQLIHPWTPTGLYWGVLSVRSKLRLWLTAHVRHAPQRTEREGESERWKERERGGRKRGRMEGRNVSEREREREVEWTGCQFVSLY